MSKPEPAIEAGQGPWAEGAPDEGPRGFLRNLARWSPPALVLCVGIGLSVAAFLWAQKHFLLTAEIHLGHIANEATLVLTRSLDRHLEAVRSVSRLYAASEEVTRDEFRAFVTPGLEKHSGIQAIEWIPAVPASARAAYEARARREGLPGFTITEVGTDGRMIPAASRPIYYPVYIVEPLTGNEKAVGFDLGSNPARLAALVRARDTSRLIASSRVTLVQEAENANGFLVFQPIYRGGKAPASVPDRRERLAGYALGVFRVKDLVAQALETLRQFDRDLELYISDASAKPEAQYLYHSPPLTGDASAFLEGLEPASGRGFHVEKKFPVAGRQWIVRFTKVGNLLGWRERAAPWAMLCFGVVFTLLAWRFLVAWRDRARMVNNLVLSRTADLSDAYGALLDEMMDRDKAEEALRESERTLRDSIESIDEGFALFDADDRLVMFNERYRDLCATVGDLLVPGVLYQDLAKTSVERGQWPELDEPGEDWLARQAHGRRPMGKNIERKLMDGRWLLIRQTRTSDGGSVDIRTDITEIKRREEALRHNEAKLIEHRDDLESIVSQRTEELRQQARQLAAALKKEKRSNERHREFVLMASHEFRTPLAIIDSTAQRIARKFDKLSREDARQRVARIRDAVERLTGLLDSTMQSMPDQDDDGGDLEFRPEADGDSVLLPCHRGETVNLEKLISGICAQHCEIKPGLKIALNLESLPARIRGESNMLYQIFANLISNAIKYSPREPRIDVTGWSEGTDAVVSIRDNGLGIPADDLRRVFDRFYRAANTTGIPGTGFGLDAVKRFTEQHGGNIEVESVDGEGSTFTLRLPVERGGRETEIQPPANIG